MLKGVYGNPASASSFSRATFINKFKYTLNRETLNACSMANLGIQKVNDANVIFSVKPIYMETVTTNTLDLI